MSPAAPAAAGEPRGGRAVLQGALVGALLGLAAGALVGLDTALRVERWVGQGLAWLAVERIAADALRGVLLGLPVGFLGALPLSGRRPRPLAARALWTLGAAAAALAWTWGGRRPEAVLGTTSPAELAATVAAALAGGLAVALGAVALARRAPPGLVAAVALAGVGAAAASPLLRPRPQGPSLVLISVDTLRANRLGCYGHAAARTPNVDALAAAGRLWETVIATAPITLPSMATVMTGLDPQLHGVRYNGYFRLGREELTLGEVLRARGYDTAAVIGNYVLTRPFRIDQGFAHFDDRMTQPMDPRGEADGEHDDEHGPARAPGRADTWWNRQLLDGNAQRYADEVTDAALAWLERAGDRPFFLWVHYMDPHMPYSPPEEFADLADPYDGEVAFTDREIGRFLAALDARGGDTVVAFLADHGEVLPGERRGGKGHVRFLFDDTVRVPFVVRAPGRVPAGERVAAPLRARAVPRVLLDVLGVEAPPRFAEPLPATGEWYAYAETFQPVIKEEGGDPLRMVRDGRWKLVRRPDGALELFDLEGDPGEHRDVAAQHPDEVLRLEALLARELARDGAVRVEAIDEATLERMRELGYVGDDGDEPAPAPGPGSAPGERP